MAESAQQYSKGTVDQWLALGMIDSRRYPNTDWWDLIMRTGTLQNYNVSASGGNDRSNFYASIGYMKQEGLQINNDYDRYNVRFNFDYNIFKNLTAGFRFDGNWVISHMPMKIAMGMRWVLGAICPRPLPG